MKEIFYSYSPSQTRKIGEELAKKWRKDKMKKTSLIIALKGDLGTGKTTFLQGFAKGLVLKEKILSPTFLIMRKFDLKPQISNFEYFYHFDCYRIKKAKEILNLGFKKIISFPQNIVAIEWAEKIKKILPKNTIWVEFKFIDKRVRKIIIKKK